MFLIYAHAAKSQQTEDKLCDDAFSAKQVLPPVQFARRTLKIMQLTLSIFFLIGSQTTFNTNTPKM